MWNIKEHTLKTDLWWIDAMEDAYNQGRSDALREILEIINKDRDNGNAEGGGFSPALCLSKVIKYLEENQK